MDCFALASASSLSRSSRSCSAVLRLQRPTNRCTNSTAPKSSTTSKKEDQKLKIATNFSLLFLFRPEHRRETLAQQKRDEFSPPLNNPWAAGDISKSFAPCTIASCVQPKSCTLFNAASTKSSTSTAALVCEHNVRRCKRTMLGTLSRPPIFPDAN